GSRPTRARNTPAKKASTLPASRSSRCAIRSRASRSRPRSATSNTLFKYLRSSKIIRAPKPIREKYWQKVVHLAVIVQNVPSHNAMKKKIAFLILSILVATATASGQWQDEGPLNRWSKRPVARITGSEESIYLTDVRVARHTGFDRLVFE